MHLKCVKFTYLKMQKKFSSSLLWWNWIFDFVIIDVQKIMNNNFYFKNRPGNIYVIYLY